MKVKEFKLGEKTYKVEYVESIDDTGLGRSTACIGNIKIAKKFYGNEIPEDSMEQTLWHEVLHVVFDELGMYDHSKNEQLLQSLAILLHQFDKGRVFYALGSEPK